nr:hypothetical protein CFP56_30742 [Quercus suber]
MKQTAEFDAAVSKASLRPVKHTILSKSHPPNWTKRSWACSFESRRTHVVGKIDIKFCEPISTASIDKAHSVAPVGHDLLNMSGTDRKHRPGRTLNRHWYTTYIPPRPALIDSSGPSVGGNQLETFDSHQ